MSGEHLRPGDRRSLRKAVFHIADVIAHHARLLTPVLLPASNLFGGGGDLRIRLPFFNNGERFLGSRETDVPNMSFLLEARQHLAQQLHVQIGVVELQTLQFDRFGERRQAIPFGREALPLDEESLAFAAASPLLRPQPPGVASD